MIIDGHAHISDSTYGNVSIYLEQLKSCGIDQGVVVPGGMIDVRKMTDYIIGKEKPADPIPNNTLVLESLLKNPGVLYGLACVDPHQANCVDMLEKNFKMGFRGLKLSPMSHQFSFASRSIADLSACCGEYGFPVYTHVVFSPGASTARLIKLARQFPKTNFVAGHMGFGPADVDALQAAAELDNFYLETSTGSFLHIQEAVRKAGAGKLIFGSEYPLSHPQVELQKILLLDLSDAARDKILSENIRVLLRLF